MPEKAIWVAYTQYLPRRAGRLEKKLNWRWRLYRVRLPLEKRPHPIPACHLMLWTCG